MAIPRTPALDAGSGSVHSATSSRLHSHLARISPSASPVITIGLATGDPADRVKAPANPVYTRRLSLSDVGLAMSTRTDVAIGCVVTLLQGDLTCIAQGPDTFAGRPLRR
jgi:hypothetical protein